MGLDLLRQKKAIEQKKAEIARIKKEIETKLGAKRQIIPSKFQYLLYLPRESQELNHENHSQQHNQYYDVFLVDDDGRSLMSLKGWIQSKKAGDHHLETSNDSHNNSMAQEKNRKRERKLKERVFYALPHSWLASNMASTDDCDRVQVNNVTYAVVNGGKRLIPLLNPDADQSPSVEWGSWTYRKSVHGTLKRTDMTKVPIYCRSFSRTGVCEEGELCKHIHDRRMQRLCWDFLNDQCHGECSLSHMSSEYNVPLCSYFLAGNCKNPACSFLHNPPPHSMDDKYSIWLCRPFSKGGWCIRGKKCPFLHLYQCPDYEEYGQCPLGNNCILQHVDSESSSDPQKIIINSFTVNPVVLFTGCNNV